MSPTHVVPKNTLKYNTFAMTMQLRFWKHYIQFALKCIMLKCIIWKSILFFNKNDNVICIYSLCFISILKPQLVFIVKM